MRTIAPPTCTEAECDQKHYGKGLCVQHYDRARNVLPLGTCGEPGCPKRTRNPSGMCRAHKRLPGHMPCGRCGEEFPIETFPRSGAEERNDKRGWRCAPCFVEDMRDRKAKRRSAQKRLRVERHGLTERGLVDLLQSQGGRCGICSRTLDGRFDIDHDHDCCPGERSCGDCVRGALCPQCNKALGLLGDSVPALLAAVEYLRNGGVR